MMAGGRQARIRRAAERKFVRRKRVHVANGKAEHFHANDEVLQRVAQDFVVATAAAAAAVAAG